MIGDGPAGRLLVAVSKALLEVCRRLGLTWRVLSSWKGVVGDALFWKGVHDELGDPARFRALTDRPRTRG